MRDVWNQIGNSHISYAEGKGVWIGNVGKRLCTNRIDIMEKIKV